MKVLKAFVLVFSIFIFVALLLVLFGFKQQQIDNRNALRLRDLTQYLAIVEQSVKENSGRIPAGISVIPHQIGTADNLCTLQTNYCTITATGCINPNSFVATPSGFIAADITAGDTKRTKYAAWLEAPTTVVLAACENETGSSISIRKDLQTTIKEIK